LGYGTTGLTVGQRVFGLADWTRNGSLAEYAAVEARNLAPLPADIDHTVAAALPISGLTAWQGLFDHGRLTAGQTVLINGAAPATVQPENARAVFFVVEPDRLRLADLAQRLRDGRLKPHIGAVRPLAEAPPRSIPPGARPGRRSSESSETGM
jgi:hypothetical protein